VLQKALEALLATLDEVTIHDFVTLNTDLKDLLARSATQRQAKSRACIWSAA